ncbi:phytoene desaturase family protein [Helicobacter pametensis]|uniref:phytoene desaturase family protein n=1 Tax=Helicobacter pametensis TaxID=95149 RepID=UPI0004BB10C6|nr:NAD(P)/FAD-dependent oxidoreductase [Helicobacter pametensis]
MQKYDAIIIGSGLGGLTCGATLAKGGKKVLVLEQHNLIGGCATCFQRKGTLIDAGLHELDFGPRDMDYKYLIFDHLNLWDKIRAVPLPTAWTIHSPNQKYTIPHGNTQEALKAMFPHEKNGIDRYFEMIKDQAKVFRRLPADMSFWQFFFAPITTLPKLFATIRSNHNAGEILDSIIQDVKLKKILNINLQYYHHDPYKFIWSYHAITQSSYYHQGAYVHGGSQALSNALASIVSEHGGEVRSRSDVTDILLDGDRAIGVRYLDKKTKGMQEVYAEYVVANCDPKIVYDRLLPKGDYSQDTDHTDRFECNTSLISIYMVFDKNLSELYPDMDYNNFIVNDHFLNLELSKSSYLDMSLEDIPLSFINYSKIDHGLNQEADKYPATITTYGNYKHWNNLSKEEYEQKKEQVREVFIRRLEAHFPGIMQHCVHLEVATPMTIQRYIKTQSGTPYGYDQSKEGFSGRKHYKSKAIKNLYFASAFNFPGGGFTGAIITGFRAAKGILDPNIFVRRGFLIGLISILAIIGLVLVAEI